MRPPQSAEPLRPNAEHAYERIAREIADELRGGLWRDGDRLPSEAAFSASLGVSRKTVRHAFDIIAGAGLIDRAQGKNAVVRNRRIEKAIGLASDFSSEARKAGLRPRTRLDSITTRRASIAEAVHLGLPAGAGVVEIIRTRLIDSLPAVWQTSVLPAQFAVDLKNVGSSDASLYNAIRSRSGIEISRTEDSLTIVTARAIDAERLKVAVGAPLVSMRRLASTRDALPIELSISLIRPEFFVFQTSRATDSDGGE